jgi:hypothetical protein
MLTLFNNTYKQYDPILWLDKYTNQQCISTILVDIQTETKQEFDYIEAGDAFVSSTGSIDTGFKRYVEYPKSVFLEATKNNISYDLVGTNVAIAINKANILNYGSDISLLDSRESSFISKELIHVHFPYFKIIWGSCIKKKKPNKMFQNNSNSYKIRTTNQRRGYYLVHTANTIIPIKEVTRNLERKYRYKFYKKKRWHNKIGQPVKLHQYGPFYYNQLFLVEKQQDILHLNRFQLKIDLLKFRKVTLNFLQLFGYIQ